MSLIPSFMVRMDIYDVLYLSYLIPAERLRPAVPDGLRFAAVLEDRTIISVIIFRSKNVRASLFPFFRFSYAQANIRTYVTDPVTGRPAVFFLKSGITSPFVAAATRILGIPWHSISLRVVAAGGSTSYQYSAEGNWEGRFSVRIGENQDRPLDWEPFRDPEDAVRFLTGPAVGLYGSPGGAIRFEVKHSPIQPSVGGVEAIDFPFLVRSGLVMEEELTLPHSALIATHGSFTIFMPPARISVS